MIWQRHRGAGSQRQAGLQPKGRLAARERALTEEAAAVELVGVGGALDQHRVADEAGHDASLLRLESMAQLWQGIERRRLGCLVLLLLASHVVVCVCWRR